jgi:maltose O-acetyltransferase
MTKIIRIFSLLLYRSIAIRLPYSFWPVFGRISSEIRRWLLLGMGCRVGTGCDIEPHVDVGLAPRLTIGDGCQINERVTLRTARLGNHVMLAPGVVLLDRQHHFARVDIPMALQGHSEREETIIQDDVWVGQNAVVMPGIMIAAGGDNRCWRSGHPRRRCLRHRGRRARPRHPQPPRDP